MNKGIKHPRKLTRVDTPESHQIGNSKQRRTQVDFLSSRRLLGHAANAARRLISTCHAGLSLNFRSGSNVFVFTVVVLLVGVGSCSSLRLHRRRRRVLVVDGSGLSLWFQKLKRLPLSLLFKLFFYLCFFI